MKIKQKFFMFWNCLLFFLRCVIDISFAQVTYPFDPVNQMIPSKRLEDEFLISRNNRISLSNLRMTQGNSGDSLNIRLVGRSLYGACFCTFVKDNYLFVGAGCTLLIFNCSDQSNIILTGKVFTKSIINDIFVDSHYAYLASVGNGLQVIDISNPSNPRKINNYCAANWPNSITVKNDYAYLSCDLEGLKIIDVSDPLNPHNVGYFKMTGLYAKDVDIKDSYAYIAYWTAGLQIIDVSNPKQPLKIGSIKTDGYTHAIKVRDNYAYIADAHDEDSGLRIVDISNPSNPIEIGFCHTKGWACDVFLKDNYAFLTDKYYGLYMIDISDPTNPYIKNSFKTCGESACSVSIDADGDHAYIADEVSGIHVLKISFAQNLKEIYTFNAGGEATAVAINGNYAYVTGGWGFFRIFDITNPENPYEISSLSLESGYQNDITFNDNHVYICHQNLTVIDVSNPFDPQKIASDIAYSRTIAIRKNFAYLSSGIVDITIPSNPIKISSFEPGNADGITIDSVYAFLGEARKGVHILNVSNQKNPVDLGYFITNGQAEGLSVKNKILYVANNYNGLCVIDVSDPTAPSILGTLATSWACDVVINKNLAIVADDYSGLRIIDITIPSSPIEVGFYNTGGYANGIACTDNYIYVADRINGFLIFEYLGRAPESPTLSNPVDNSITNDNTPTISWNIPCSKDCDQLHFKVEIAANNSFANQIIDSPFESQNNPSGFNPTPPVPQGKGTCSFTLLNPLQNGDYWWRVTAWDGNQYSQPSEAWKFSVNVLQVYLLPIVHDHQLHEEFNVDVQVKDAQNLFGIAFKLNFPVDRLEAISTTPGELLGSDLIFFPNINNTDGNVSVGVSKKSGQSAANGTGIVARIKLKEKPSVTSGITIELSLTEVITNDPEGNAIALTTQNVSYVTPNPTLVHERNNQVPDDYALYPNYPNPFNPTTTISFALPQAAHVQVQIFDVNGREVKRLVDKMCSAGVYSVMWNGTDEVQQKVSSGIYICRFSAGEVVLNRKLVLAK